MTVTGDEKYGPDPRNRLDIFQPAGAGSALRPVLLFVHGSAFIGGDKHMPGSPYYDNVMLWVVANGMVGVNVTYRLAPEHPYPAGAEDVALAVQWTLDDAAKLGGDPRRVFLMGHSAGAVHVATYVAHPEFQTVKSSGLAGAILVSGIYEFTPDTDQPPQRAYLGNDLATWTRRLSLKGLVATSLPLLVARAELDPSIFEVQADVLKAAMCAAPNGCPTYVLLQGQSHMSEIYSINTVETHLTDPIKSFVSKPK